MQRSLEQWLTYIEQQHVTEIDMGLSRVMHVWHALGHDFDSQTVVTIAGTNGKGTTTACIEALLLAANCRVGVYSSPHLLHFNERMRIQSNMASDADICAAFEHIESARENISLTYFEYATLAALLVFAKHKVDVVLLEVGLGGRLDATNIIDADVSVITSIGFDHQSYLGDTLAEIAFEKAGIIKPASDVVFGITPEQYALPLNTFVGNQVTVVPDVSIIDRENLTISLRNTIDNELPDELLYRILNRQVPLQNVLVALACFLHLIKKLPLYSDSMRMIVKEKALVEQAISDVRLAGRYQAVYERPNIVFDVAHNAQAAEYLCTQLSGEKYQRLYFVVGMLTDKNIEATLSELLPVNGDWICCDLAGPRGEKAERLSSHLSNEGQNVVRFTSVEKGLLYAMSCAEDTDLICVFGSFVTVAEATDVLKKLQSEK